MPQLLRAPFCLGSTCDQAPQPGKLPSQPNYVLVYKMAPHSKEDIDGVESLDVGLDHMKKPTLEDRMALATTLAESLYYLHSVNFLHKRITRWTVIFESGPFHEDLDCRRPILSKFDFSKLGVLEKNKNKVVPLNAYNLYRHQDTLHQRIEQARSHDIFGLGVILIEVALWKRIENVIDKDSEDSQKWYPALEKVNEDGDDLRPNMKAEVGTEYTNAVSCCIIGGERLGLPPDHAETEQDAIQVQEAFYNNVIQKLRRLTV